MHTSAAAPLSCHGYPAALPFVNVSDFYLLAAAALHTQILKVVACRSEK